MGTPVRGCDEGVVTASGVTGQNGVVSSSVGSEQLTGSFTGVIAIDGPSGSGKSTVSRRVASILGAGYLDTGAMYRALTYAVLRAGVRVDDQLDTEAVLTVLDRTLIDIGTDPARPTTKVDGQRVDAEIRTTEVTGAVSAVSAIPRVREVLVARQRAVALAGGVVIEGRDITTVVAPDADVRVLLTASADARAARRSAETGTTSEAQREAMSRRDTMDARTSGFLAATDGVLVLDSTELGIDEVVHQLLDVVSARTGFSPQPVSG